MIQGTTPTLLFNLPFHASVIKSAEISIKYVDNLKKVLIIKTLEDCQLEGTTISTRLTQEETLQLPASSTIQIQLRILTTDDIALATAVQTRKVKKLLSEGVIE